MGIKLKRVYEYEGQVVYAFRCLGCNEEHQVRLEGPYAWKWNGSLESPTIRNSILVNGSKSNPTAEICHSFVTDGKIEYLGDCSHNLKGQTIELPDWWEDETHRP
jgi:uncharacterized protein DUF6527